MQKLGSGLQMTNFIFKKIIHFITQTHPFSKLNADLNATVKEKDVLKALPFI